MTDVRVPDHRPEISLANSLGVSFRDPAGRLMVTDRRALRLVNEEYRDQVNDFLTSALYSELVDQELMIDSRRVEDAEFTSRLKQFPQAEVDGAMLLEHEFIVFPSYPYEWAPEMLHAAGVLTLDLMEQLLAHSFGLKDATPSNILFRGSKPLFVDLLSVEKRNPRDPTWLPYSQFVSTFIRPLLASKYFGVGLDQIFRVYRDGLQSEQMFRLCSFWQQFQPRFLTSVTVPALLSRIAQTRYQNIYQPRQLDSAEQATFILKRQLKGLRRKLHAAKPRAVQRSPWLGYESSEQRREHYLPAKHNFVEAALKTRKPRRVLDVGCNLGSFSLLAARAGASLIAIDRDPVVVGALWRKVFERKLDIHPMVIDLTRPTSGLGWRNRETKSFLERALGHFDTVLMLAVVHHMLVTERIPLTEIIKLLWELTTDLAIVEFVPPDDEMFRSLARGNDHLYQYLTRELFEGVCGEYFVIERVEELANSGRLLYQLRRHAKVA